MIQQSGEDRERERERERERQMLSHTAALGQRCDKQEGGCRGLSEQTAEGEPRLWSQQTEGGKKTDREQQRDENGRQKRCVCVCVCVCV